MISSNKFELAFTMSNFGISLSPEEVKHIALFASQDATVIEEFCKQAKNFINEDQKINSKMMNSAAKKLGFLPVEVSDYFGQI